ncbi:MAG: hypothetical protein M3680_20390, partial [Myxococcota bacterium]|nr:hypothetical protein [Myxococcota bacterium]
VSARFVQPAVQPTAVPLVPPPHAFAAGTERPALLPVRSPPSDDAVHAIDIDLDSGPISFAGAAPPPPPPDGMPELFALVDLDDAGVEKDPTQIGQPLGKSAASTLPPGFGKATSSTLPPGFAAPSQPTLPPATDARDKKP